MTQGIVGSGGEERSIYKWFKSEQQEIIYLILSQDLHRPSLGSSILNHLIKTLTQEGHKFYFGEWYKGWLKTPHLKSTGLVEPRLVLHNEKTYGKWILTRSSQFSLA